MHDPFLNYPVDFLIKGEIRVKENEMVDFLLRQKRTYLLKNNYLVQ